MKSTDGWHPTPAHARAVLGGLLLAIGAVAAGRPDLLVLAAPLIAAAVWGVLLRPSQVPEIRQHISHPAVREGDATTWAIDIIDEEGRVEDVAAVFDAPVLVDQNPVGGQLVVGLSDPGSSIDPGKSVASSDSSDSGDTGSSRGQLSVAIRPTRWGRYRLNPVYVVAASGWNSFRFSSVHWLDNELTALPGPTPFDPVAAEVRARGLVGDNRSPRPGRGAEFASIRLFQPGDKLRRIHWPESLRTGELHVTSTWADHDRHVMLLIDAFDDVGKSEGVDGRSSSLDIALRAAAAIAEHYIRTGNRVALVALGAHGMQRVPPGAGHAHLRRLLEAMVQSTPSSGRFDRGQVPRGISNDALIVMLSPLLSDGSHRRLSKIAASANSVVAIDCLPTDIAEQYHADPYEGFAWRMERLQRETRLRQIRTAGIAVVPWIGPSSLDQVLRSFQSKVSTRTKHHG